MNAASAASPVRGTTPLGAPPSDTARAGVDRTSWSSQVDEWPYEVFPTGWFQIGWIDDIECGSVTPLHYFGTDLVRFRTEAGDVHVLDAYCGHLGAHIGHGGWVEGDCVVCPFHGWQWAGDGTNRYVPAEDRAVQRRRQRSWPIEVTNGMVWMWYDSAGRAPLWDPHPTLPELTDGGSYYPLLPHCIREYPAVGGRPQYLIENNTDVEHLRWVHGTRSPVRLVSQEADGPYLNTSISVVYGHGRKSTRFTPDGPVETTLDSSTQGVGANMVRYPLDGTVSFYCATPVDDSASTLFQTVFLRRDGSDDAAEPAGLAAARLRELVNQFQKDFPIWSHQHYIKKSPLTRDEAKPMGYTRQWARQFYPGH